MATDIMHCMSTQHNHDGSDPEVQEVCSKLASECLSFLITDNTILVGAHAVNFHCQPHVCVPPGYEALNYSMLHLG